MRMTPSTAAVSTPFDTLQLDELRKRTSAKWQYYPEDVLPLWVAEMDAYTAEPIVEAVHDALLLGDTGYRGPVCVEVEYRAYEGSITMRHAALVQSATYLRNFLPKI